MKECLENLRIILNQTGKCIRVHRNHDRKMQLLI